MSTYIYTYTYSSSYFECRSMQKCNIGNTHHLQLQTSGAILSAAQRTYFFAECYFDYIQIPIFKNFGWEKGWLDFWPNCDTWWVKNGSIHRSTSSFGSANRDPVSWPETCIRGWKNCPRLKNVMEYLNNQYARTGLNDVKCNTPGNRLRAARRTNSRWNQLAQLWTTKSRVRDSMETRIMTNTHIQLLCKGSLHYILTYHIFVFTSFQSSKLVRTKMGQKCATPIKCII